MTQLVKQPVYTPRRASAQRSLGIVFALITGIVGLYAVYSQAEGLTWQFDDYFNLKTLADASSVAGVLNFVFGGGAGPFGRPLALATFLASYGDWPTNPWGMVQLTFVIHAMNGALVFLVLNRVLGSPSVRDMTGSRAPWLALAAALLWLWLPMHASSLLMPVQRMTHVSAFFVLVSLYGFVVLRQRQGGAVPTFGAMVLLSLWLAGTVLLAMLSKENGVVAITFASLIELFCFYPHWRREAAGSRGKLWRLLLVLAGVTVATVMLVHVFTRWQGLRESFELYRGYHWNEHIATQWVISLEYLRQIVLPRSALLGPFHDNHTVFTWNTPPPFMALALWAGLLCCSVWCGKNERQSLEVRTLGWAGCAAILWFFAGHQVESTLLPLELYFEHRNYLASLGICFLLVLTFDRFLQTAHRKIVPCTLASIYLAFLGFSLFQLTSLWGQPLLAHDLWQKNHPHSTRATQAVIQDLMGLGYQNAAFSLADDFVHEMRALDVSIQMLTLRCKHSGHDEQRRSFYQLQQLVPELKAPGGIPTGLAGLGAAVRNGNCSNPKADEYESFLRQLLATPQVAHAVKVRHHIYYELALMAKQRENMLDYIEYLKKAFWDFPTISIAQLVAATLFQEERIDEAIEWIDIVIRDAPNVSLRKAWRDTLQSMREALVHIHQSLHDPASQPLVPPSQTQ